MPACLETARPTAPSVRQRTCAPRALLKFEREQLIVDVLNRGVSLAKIAARVGLSEKRMRAIICDPPDWDPGARPMPHPAEPFAAIQVGRLNEAPLVAFAMTGANLEAADRVATIIRELDRYHGAFVAAERRRSEPSCSGASAGGATAYGGTVLCSAELAARDGGEIGWTAAPRPHPEEPAKRASRRTLEEAPSCPLEPPSRRDACGAAPQDEAAGANGGHAERYSRPENPAQAIEKVDSAPGVSTPPETIGGAGAARPGTRAAALDKVGREAPAADNHPENPAQTLEKVDSAPGLAPDPQLSAVATGRNLLRDATLCVAPQHEGGECPSAAAAADDRPEILPQTLEKVDSAPGIAPDPQSSAVATGRNLLRDATLCVAHQHEGGKRPSAAAAADNRPEILLQAVEKVDSAPGEIEASRRRRPPRPPRALDPGIAGTTGAPGAKFPGGGRRPEPRRSPEGVHGGPLRRLSSRYPTTCIVSHVAASAGLCWPSISTLTS